MQTRIFIDKADRIYADQNFFYIYSRQNRMEKVEVQVEKIAGTGRKGSRYRTINSQ